MDSSGRWQQVLIGDNIGRRTLKFSLSLKDFIDGSAIGIRHNIENIEAFSGEFHAQRNLDTNHAAGLGRYTLMRLVRAAIKSYGTDTTEQMLEIRNQHGDPAYVSLQPVVCNIRTCVPEGLDLQIRDVGDSRGIKTVAYAVLIGQKQQWVVDGQHRKAGFEKVWDFLKRVTQTHKYPMKITLFVPSNYTNELIDHTTHAFWSRIMEIALTKAAISVECHLGLKEDEE